MPVPLMLLKFSHFYFLLISTFDRNLSQSSAFFVENSMYLFTFSIVTVRTIRIFLLRRPIFFMEYELIESTGTFITEVR